MEPTLRKSAVLIHIPTHFGILHYVALVSLRLTHSHGCHVGITDSRKLTSTKVEQPSVL